MGPHIVPPVDPAPSSELQPILGRYVLRDVGGQAEIGGRIVTFVSGELVLAEDQTFSETLRWSGDSTAASQLDSVVLSGFYELAEGRQLYLTTDRGRSWDLGFRADVLNDMTIGRQSVGARPLGGYVQFRYGRAP